MIAGVIGTNTHTPSASGSQARQPAQAPTRRTVRPDDDEAHPDGEAGDAVQRVEDVGEAAGVGIVRGGDRQQLGEGQQGHAGDADAVTPGHGPTGSGDTGGTQGDLAREEPQVLDAEPQLDRDEPGRGERIAELTVGDPGIHHREEEAGPGAEHAGDQADLRLRGGSRPSSTSGQRGRMARSSLDSFTRASL